MTSGSSPTAPAVQAAALTGLQPALKLAVGRGGRERHTVNLHAVLNLLNRFAGTRDEPLREDMVSRLGDYLAAAHRLEAGPDIALPGLCELARSYAAMRYLMADAIEPRVTWEGADFRLRTEQSADMAAFLQGALDSLLQGFTPWVHLSLQPVRWWTVELTLIAGAPPHGGQGACPGWSRLPGGAGFARSARFTAIAQAMPRTSERPRP